MLAVHTRRMDGVKMYVSYLASMLHLVDMARNSLPLPSTATMSHRSWNLSHTSASILLVGTMAWWFIGCQPLAGGSRKVPSDANGTTVDSSVAAPTAQPSASFANSATPAPVSSGSVAILDHPSTTLRDDPPPLYAKLFEEGRVWAISGSEEATVFDDAQTSGFRTTTTPFRASCRVNEVKRMARVVASHIVCSSLPQLPTDDPFSGHWVSASDGLYHSNSAPTDDQDREWGDFVIERSPAKPQVQKGHNRQRTVEHKSNAWCNEVVTWSGDDFLVAICLEPRTGFVSGRWFFGGGSEVDATAKASLVR